MLHHRVVLFAAPLHGVELAGLLFADYIQSSLFQMDVTEALCDVNGVFAFFRSGFQLSALLHFYSRLISERLLFRLLECGVSTVCMYSSSDACKDAIAFHYIFPIVRDYRYSRFWLTRLLRFVGHILCPPFLRRMMGVTSGTSSGMRTNAAATATAKGKSPKAAPASTAPKLFERGADADAEVSFYRSPPRPSRMEPFDGMPESCRDALQYYLYSYQSRPYYTAFISGLISDVSLFTAEQIMWCTYFYQERTKSTSRWRMWKPYLSDLAVVLTQSTLVYGARVAGVCVGQKVSREPTGGGLFWGEHLTLLVLSPAIQYASMRVGLLVREALERRHPRTVADEMEDARVEEEAEAAERAQAAAARAAFVFAAGPSGSGDASGHTAAGGAAGGSGALSGNTKNYYEVLGVSEQAKAPEIKKAYRAMALQNHPDRVRKDAAAQQSAREQMSIINEAYDTLIDADKRMQYDATRRFAEGSDIFKKLESMSTAQLAAVSAGAVVGLGALAVVSAYGQYLTIFQRITSPGRGPLQLFT
jgi:DnaJ-domain-containing protein 1